MSKTIKITLVVLASLVLIMMSFTIGCMLNYNQTSATGGPDTSLINEAWEIINRYYVEPENIDDDALNEGAVRGIVAALNDPYSSYLSPEAYELEQTDYQGSFGGIGAQVSVNKDNRPIIVAPLDGTPAAEAGIKTGDIILEVDGVSTDTITLLEAINMIRGEIGTNVTLTILHEGESVPVEITLVRAEINAPTVKSEMIDDIAYIQIMSFNEKTNEQVEAALESFDLDNTSGIILDLRDNPGGLVTAVVDVASHFIKDGVVITLRDNEGNTQSKSVNPNGTYTELPMVVLVNEYSASGSEVLSGVLQDYGRATIAGKTTFGKGSYDSFFPLSDGSAIYLTIGRWLTPNGREIEGQGITPDYELTETGDDGTQWAVDFLHQHGSTWNQDIMK